MKNFSGFNLTRYRTVVIKNWPDEDFLYNIFLRLNTGSKKLLPQELRQALHPGKFLQFLDDVTSESKVMKTMLGNDSADPRMQDIELALRYFAFKYFISNYKGNLKVFLDDACLLLNSRWEFEENQIKDSYRNLEEIIIFCTKFFESKCPFSKYTSKGTTNKFNRQIFEIMTYYLSIPHVMDMIEANRDEFLQKFASMNDDRDFANSISLQTTDKSKVIVRFNKFHELLCSLSIKPNKIDLPKLKLHESESIEIENVTVSEN